MNSDGQFDGLDEDKKLRYQAYEETIKGFGTPVQSMFILDSDGEIDIFEEDITEFLKYTGRYKEDDEKPFRKFSLGFDGDMNDELYREVIKLPDDMWKPSKSKGEDLASKQEVFRHLYRTITQDKPCIIHVSEFPLLFLFEQASTVDLGVDADSESGGLELTMENDGLIIEHLRIMREQGEYDLRIIFEMFYRISTALLMELSNIFLSAPTDDMNRHIVVMTWRTQSLLLGFSPLTWSSGAFNMYDLSGQDIDGRYSYPVTSTDNPEEKGYKQLHF